MAAVQICPTIEDNTICSKCKGITSDLEVFLFTPTWPEPRYRHHNSYRLLSLSAKDGCVVCQTISEALLESAISRGRVVDLFTSEHPISIMGIGSHDPNKSYILVEVRQVR